MRGTDPLCEVVTSLSRDAGRFLPIRGLGVLHTSADGVLDFTYVDGVGTTGYQGVDADWPAAMRVQPNARQHLVAADLDVNAMGLVESRLLHPVASDDVRRLCRADAVMTVPVPGMGSAILIAALSGSAPIVEGE